MLCKWCSQSSTVNRLRSWAFKRGLMNIFMFLCQVRIRRAEGAQPGQSHFLYLFVCFIYFCHFHNSSSNGQIGIVKPVGLRMFHTVSSKTCRCPWNVLGSISQSFINHRCVTWRTVAKRVEEGGQAQRLRGGALLAQASTKWMEAWLAATTWWWLQAYIYIYIYSNWM